MFSLTGEEKIKQHPETTKWFIDGKQGTYDTKDKALKALKNFENSKSSLFGR